MSRNRNYRQLEEESDLLWEKLTMLSAAQRELFDERLLISWIFHDFAIEGTVLQLAEIKASIDDEIISAPSLIPQYFHIMALRDGIRHIYAARGEPITLSLEWIKKLHQILLPQDKKDQVQYRKDNPIHRLYFHDLAPADKISYRMRKLTDWLRSEEAARMHPIELAGSVHRELIRVFPWPENSGRLARLCGNHILISHGFWPAVIHHVDRHRYYDALKSDQDDILDLSMSAMDQGLAASNRMYRQIVDTVRRW